MPLRLLSPLLCVQYAKALDVGGAAYFWHALLCKAYCKANLVCGHLRSTLQLLTGADGRVRVVLAEHLEKRAAVLARSEMRLLGHACCP